MDLAEAKEESKKERERPLSHRKVHGKTLSQKSPYGRYGHENIHKLSLAYLLSSCIIGFQKFLVQIFEFSRGKGGKSEGKGKTSKL